jgi:hypothetical protein
LEQMVERIDARFCASGHTVKVKAPPKDTQRLVATFPRVPPKKP